MQETGKKIMDKLSYRWVHQGGIRESQKPWWARTPIHRGIMQSHRRLDSRHKRNPIIYNQVQQRPPDSVGGASADTNTRTGCEPPAGNRKFCTQRHLGTQDSLQRHHIFFRSESVCDTGSRWRNPERCGTIPPYGYRCRKEKRERGSTSSLWPDISASWMQQEIRHGCWRHSQSHTIALWEKTRHIPSCRYNIPDWRHVSQMQKHTEWDKRALHRHPAAIARWKAKKKQKGIRQLQSYWPPRNHSYRSAPPSIPPNGWTQCVWHHSFAFHLRFLPRLFFWTDNRQGWSGEI